MFSVDSFDRLLVDGTGALFECPTCPPCGGDPCLALPDTVVLTEYTHTTDFYPGPTCSGLPSFTSVGELDEAHLFVRDPENPCVWTGAPWIDGGSTTMVLERTETGAILYPFPGGSPVLEYVGPGIYGAYSYSSGCIPEISEEYDPRQIITITATISPESPA